MSRCRQVRRDRIIHHFILRYRQRGIERFIGIETLLDEVEKLWLSGEYVEDRPGVEGLRYRIPILVDGYKIVVIVEETCRCLLPITIWFEKIH